ncbi:hypothetical protein NIES2101_18940 [Calothrix sp. HK-06]|nr:hypothetical protein NIES2101_18940 [Calothrix sp. HK-06]
MGFCCDTCDRRQSSQEELLTAGLSGEGAIPPRPIAVKLLFAVRAQTFSSTRRATSIISTFKGTNP